MDTRFEKISAFVKKHHLLTLATSAEDELHACSLFYAFDEKKFRFLVASELKTQHILDVTRNPKVAGTIALETKEVGLIQGLQFRATMQEVQDTSYALSLYLRRFPYAATMLPRLWEIQIHHCKLTDNRLGFGKKIIYP